MGVVYGVFFFRRIICIAAQNESKWRGDLDDARRLIRQLMT